MKVFQGTIIHCINLEPSGFQVLKDHLIGVNNKGRIQFLASSSQKQQLFKQYGFGEHNIVQLGNRLDLFPFFSLMFLFTRMLVPGLIDTHIHAPQYAIAGTGTELPLLEWLNRYTFPTEKTYKDQSFCKNVFAKVVARYIYTKKHTHMHT